jgi:hypothetical protein
LELLVNDFSEESQSAGAKPIPVFFPGPAGPSNFLVSWHKKFGSSLLVAM